MESFTAYTTLFIVDKCRLNLGMVLHSDNSLSANHAYLFCSAAYMSQTQTRQSFTVSRVAADCHELMIPWNIMWPFIV